MATVNYYTDNENDLVHTYCAECAKKSHEKIEYVDKAGDWEECETCLAENVPVGYQPTHRPAAW